jgi:hypothetical protein
MNVTKDVIQDLVVIYMSGEASADTRRLVEEYLAADPEMADRVKASQSLAIPVATPPPDLERRALDQTRRLLSRKHVLLWLAMFMSYIPVSFSFNPGDPALHFRYLDRPLEALPFVALAIVFWTMFLITCRRLRGTGLEPLRRWQTRTLWILGGMAAALPFLTLLSYWTGHKLLYYVPVFGSIALMIGEKLGQVSRPGPEPPLSLFGPK